MPAATKNRPVDATQLEAMAAEVEEAAAHRGAGGDEPA